MVGQYGISEISRCCEAYPCVKTSLVYGTIIAWIGSLAVAASLAEMASMYVSKMRCAQSLKSLQESHGWGKQEQEPVYLYPNNLEMKAQYKWTSQFAPPGFGSRAFWGLIQGKEASFASVMVC